LLSSVSSTELLWIARVLVLVVFMIQVAHMVAVIKLTWKHKTDGKCSKFAHDWNKIQGGCDLHCLYCAFL